MDEQVRPAPSAHDQQTTPPPTANAPPSIATPKGGGAVRGIGEKFGANPVTGTASMAVPIASSPSRSGFGPQLSLSYNSGAGNGPFGFGWGLSLPTITRKTDQGLPRYLDAEESDVFILSGTEDLVPVFRQDPDGTWVAGRPGFTRDADGAWVRDSAKQLVPHEDDIDGFQVRRYRPRIEGLFARIERWSRIGNPADVHWRSIAQDNVLTLYGNSAESRIVDPADATRIFSWLIAETRDDRGNGVVYRYKPDDGAGIDTGAVHERHRGAANDARRAVNRYPKRILYGNRSSYLVGGLRPRTVDAQLIETRTQAGDWMFELVFDYGEHDDATPSPAETRAWPARDDPISTYRAGFEIRTTRLCQRALMFHHFPAETGVGANCLVRSTDLAYSAKVDPNGAKNPVYAFLEAVTQAGYRRTNGGYERRAFPPVEFEYTDATIRDVLETADAATVENLPFGLDGALYRWIDLHGEGTPGVLTEQGGAWHYRRNESSLSGPEAGPRGRAPAFGPLERVRSTPNASLAGGAEFMDLAGDGTPDVVVMEGATQGFYEHDGVEGWEPFRTFPARLARDTRDPNARFVDLDGDGRADLLVTEHDALVWHASLGEDGFGPATRVAMALDEEQGPRVVFSDGTQSIYLGDFSGDGLLDVARVRNGEVCYWPNLGYGRFGDKVTMTNPPWFDHADRFDHRRVRLADIDGSGTSDLMYLHPDGVRLYFNQSGNGWSAAQVLSALPSVDDSARILPLDLLGNGTTCLVWSSLLPRDTGQPMRYLRLLDEKPHLLRRVVNNLGAETRVTYAPSTMFYLLDKRAGRPWLTRLPFPVHVVERVETYDHVSRNRFVARYAYHHGYFDGAEREFRGFGMVEQWDTEELAALNASGTLPSENVSAMTHVPAVHTKTWYHTGVYLGRDHVSDYFAGLLDADDIGEYFREPGLTDALARALCLPDTVLPGGLSVEEEREACRALKGLTLRTEVYADDAGPGATPEQLARALTPYTVTEHTFSIRRVQSRGHNRHGVFITHPREVLNYHYERNPADPRVQHSLILEVDDVGNPLKEATIGYGRRGQIRVIGASGVAQLVPNPGLAALSAADRAKQTTPLVTFTEHRYTRAILGPDEHRGPLAAETTTYELTGYPATGDGGRYRAEDFLEADPGRPRRLRHRFGAEVPYEIDTPGPMQRRPVEWARTLYRRNDLSALLPLGVAESKALTGESYRLAFTPGLLATAYRRAAPGQAAMALLPDPAAVLGGQGGARGGFVASQTLRAAGLFPATDADGHWWAPSGRSFYSADPLAGPATERTAAELGFFVPRRYRDPHGQDTLVEFDANELMLAATQDAAGNRVTTVNDYRVLQPRVVTDPNGNRSETAYDALGLVVGTAVMGKVAPAPVEGDSLAGFAADLTPAELDAFAQTPRLPGPTPAGSVAAPIVHQLLGGASTRIVYDVDRYRRLGEPAFAATVVRETHVSDLAPGETSKLHVAISYSDGFGREVQKKIQAEPGQLVPGGATVSPRWVGSGWMIYNNKGKPVRRYEPFFSATHDFEFGVMVGASRVLFYDPAGRLVATVQPHDTYEKVVFDAWRQTSYDQNDTSAPRSVPLGSPPPHETGDPRTDPDIGGFVAEYFKALPPGWQTWYAQRSAGALGAHEAAAAERALAHADTPTIAHFDVLGRPFLTEARNRVVCAGHDQDGTEATLTARVDLDIEGHQRALRDADHQGGDTLGRVVARMRYDVLGNVIHQQSMEAGARWMLNDATGNVIRAWDARGHGFINTYDPLRRPLEQTVRGAFAGGPAASDPDTLGRDVLIDRIEYGESVPGGAALNLRTRLYRRFDSAGLALCARLDSNGVPVQAYDFKGNLRGSTRWFLADYATGPDWLQNPALASEAFEGAARYDAMNRAVQSIAPRSDRPQATVNVLQPVFNEAKLLDRMDVWLDRGSEPGQVLDRAVHPASPVGVSNIDYNPQGKRERIVYANGVVTSYEYDPNTWRIARLLTRRGADRLQDLRYTYDAVGNVTHLRDDAQQTIYFANQQIDPSADYVYDATYRLIQATGREHLGQTGDPIPHAGGDADRIRILSAHQTGRFAPNDQSAMGTYVERYVYDVVGNMLAMQHRRTDLSRPGWTRAFAYDVPSALEDGTGGTVAKTSNRLARSTLHPTAPNPQVEPLEHDANGNLIHAPHLRAGLPGTRPQNVFWNYRNQMRQVDLGGGGRAYYVYDGPGRRVRKVWEKAPGLTEERLYLGGAEVFRRHAGPIGDDTATLERETLHLSDDKRRIALVETRTRGTASTDPAPARLIRYQLGNHADSATLELDEQAAIVSYEEYSPFGSTTYQAVRRLTETPKRYRFTGKERDEESGFYYHVARYYAPWIARWTSPDPVGIAEGPNLYLYAKNDPIGHVDPSGLAATKQQFQEVVSTALQKVGGNRTAAGTAAEAVLEGMLQKAGYIVIKGPVNNPGQHFADLVVYDPANKELLFFDNKVQTKKANVSRAEAFVRPGNDTVTQARKAGVVADAEERFRAIESSLPEEHLDDIRKAFAKATADPSSAKFFISNATPNAVKNLVERISQRLIDKGVRFADASQGRHKLKSDIDASFAKNADTTADALEAAGGAGKKLLKQLPAIGLGVSAALAVPRVAAAAEEDEHYAAMMREMGAEPKLEGLSTLRELAIIGGEESGGELGGWGGAAAGAAVSWETGPGVIVGTVGGALIFGFAGDSVGGWAAGYFFDVAAEDLYEERVLGAQVNE